MAEGQRLQEPQVTLQVTLLWPDRVRAWLFPGPLVQPTLLGQGRASHTVLPVGLPCTGGIWVLLRLGGF